MSTESNLVWGLLALGLLASAGGYAAGYHRHRDKDPLRLAFRKAASKVMNDAENFFKIAKLREKEIAPSNKRFRSHGELPLTAADKAYFTTGTKEARDTLEKLREAEMILTKKQRERLEKLRLNDISVVAPIVARQSGIKEIPHQLGKHHPDKLLPDQIHVGQQGGTITVSTTTPSGKPINFRAQFGELRSKLQKALPNKEAVIAEIKNKHAGLLASLKQHEPDYWKRTLENFPELA